MATTVAAFLLLFAGVSILLLWENTDESQIKIDGNIGDWSGTEKVADSDETNVENANIDLVEVSLYIDEIYLSLYAETKEPMFISSSPNTLRIMIDSDNNIDTGYLAPGIGADHLVEIYGFNQAIFTSVLYTFNNNRDHTDWNGFNALSTVNSARDGRFVEAQISLFDLGINDNVNVAVIWQTADNNGNTDDEHNDHSDTGNDNNDNKHKDNNDDDDKYYIVYSI